MRKLMSGLVLAIALALPGVASAAGEHDGADLALECGDFATALDLYRAAGEAGDVSAQVTLGYMFWYGEDQYGSAVHGDLNTAVEWFDRAADQGDPVAAAMIYQIFGGDGPWNRAHAFAATVTAQQSFTY